MFSGIFQPKTDTIIKQKTTDGDAQRMTKALMKRIFTAVMIMLATVTASAADQTPWGRLFRMQQKDRGGVEVRNVMPLGRLTTAEGDSIITTQPAGTLYDNYARYGIGWFAYMDTGYSTPYFAFLGSVVVDGDNYYFKNPFNALSTGSWIKGARKGDVITVKTPQPVLEYTDGDTGEDITLYAKRLVWNSDSTGFQPDTLSDGSVNNDITYRVSGDSIIQTDGGQLALCSATNDWYGYGDEQVFYTLVTDKAVEKPEGLDFSTYTLSYTTLDNTPDTLVAKVAFDGNKVYLSDIYPNIGTCVVGTRDGNTVTFPSKQYLGGNDYYQSHLYFMGVTKTQVYDPVYEETYDGYVLNDKVTFTLGDGNVLTSDSAYAINAGNSDIYYIQDFASPVLTPFVATPATPIAPYGVDADLSNEPTSGYNYASFFMDKRDVEGNFIDPARLSYQLVTTDPDGKNMEPYTFYADTYRGLANDTTLMPYNFTNGSSIQGSYNQRNIILYDEFYGGLGVRSAYTVGDDTRYSDMVWIVPAGISGVNAGKAVKRVDYYDVAGRHLADPISGFYIQSVTYADGTVKNTKLLKR